MKQYVKARWCLSKRGGENLHGKHDAPPPDWNRVNVSAKTWWGPHTHQCLMCDSLSLIHWNVFYLT